MEAASIEASTREFARSDSSRNKAPETLENWPFTFAIIMCLTLNSAMEWAGSMFQVVVVVEVCTAATVFAMVASLFISSIYIISTSIYMMSSIITGFTFLWKTAKSLQKRFMPGSLC